MDNKTYSEASSKHNKKKVDNGLDFNRKLLSLIRESVDKNGTVIDEETFYKLCGTKNEKRRVDIFVTINGKYIHKKREYQNIDIIFELAASERERIDTIQWKSYIYKKHWAKQKKLLMVIRGYPNDDFYDGFDDEGNKRYNNPEGERKNIQRCIRDVKDSNPYKKNPTKVNCIDAAMQESTIIEFIKFLIKNKEEPLDISKIINSFYEEKVN